MEENDNFLNLSKTNFKDKNFRRIIVSSALISLVFILIFIFLLWYFRGNVFEYLASSYLDDTRDELLSENSEGNQQTFFSQESFVVDAVKKSNPSVVSILVLKEVPKYEVYLDQQNPFGSAFPNFFFNVPKYRQDGTEEREVGGGSGFFVSEDGLIVTNKHVVADEDAIYKVFTNDQQEYDAKVIARDPVLDIALIKVEKNISDFPVLALGDSDLLDIGQSVIAIGNALGEFSNTVSVGVVSGLSRSITAGDLTGNFELLDHVIQTDAAINPGNSGEPLLDLYGRVIGVNVAVAQGSENIGFALPINSIKGAIDSVKATGKIIRPYIGIRYVPVTKEMKEKNNLSVDYGVLIKSGTDTNELAVIPGSPADKAGLLENDIILEIDGEKLNEKTNFASVIRQKKVGDTISLKVLSKGAEKTVLVTLEEAKE